MPSYIVEKLRAHLLRRHEEVLRLGAHFTADTPIVSQQDARPLQPNSLTHAFVRIRFHDLHHPHATHLLANGVYPKVAQERIGHSTITITLDLYSHVMPPHAGGRRVNVDAAMRAAINKRAGSIE